jgi:hypothetical protein
MHCGHEFDNKAVAAKGAGARFKGTMMMSAPAIAKPAAAQPAAQPAPAPAPAPVAAAPAAAQAPTNKGAAKQTMIGTGIGPLAGAKPAAAAAQPAAAAPVARAPVAAAAPAPEAKRNMAFAQTQHQAAFAAVSAPVRAPAAAAAPAVEPLGIAATPMAPRPEPEPEPSHYDAADEGNYLPGDPMAPQSTTHARSPVLRYDDSIPDLPRHNPLQDKKVLWIAAGVIGFVCLGLVMLLISKLMN